MKGKQIFLTCGSYYKDDTTLINDVIPHIANTRIETQGKKLVFIDTAAEIFDYKPWFWTDRQSLIDVGFDLIDYTITGKTKDQIKYDLEQCEVIYISSGNTFYLLQQAQLCEFNSIIRDMVLYKNKIYIGGCAGSIIAGPDISPTFRIQILDEAPLLRGFEGFGLVNFCVFPHWGDDTIFKEIYLNKRMIQAYTHNQIPIILMTNNQYVHIQGDKMEIVDMAKEIREKYTNHQTLRTP